MIAQGKARFTVITPTLIRMEYETNGAFVDAPSFFAIDRNARYDGSTVTRDGNKLTIDTGAIRLVYQEDGQPFSPANLSAEIRQRETTVRWTPEMKPAQNLGGTLRTLDGVVGPKSLGDGLLSRDGWSLVDDSDSVLLVDGWFQERTTPNGVDWYLFGYGNDFKQALRDLTVIGGPVPMPRKYAMGIWYSRWWPYTADEFKGIVNEYASHDFPLDVLVMDMDWHLNDPKSVPEATRPKGQMWTGYTWNRQLIPDPPGLLAWLHQQGVAVTLNDHPSAGLLPYEDAYPGFMKAMGADPASGKVIPYDASDRKFMSAYYEAPHRSHEKEGVDFWWLDWQQEPLTRGMKSLTNLQALAYSYFQETDQNGKRGQDMSRWAGWGDHRYPIYFSGDASTTWDMLAFEVPFTTTAGNVGCFYWSNDTGGFGGPRLDETYTRWCQFGAFSPVLRCHSSHSPQLDRRPWTYPQWAEDSMRRAFHLRSEWMPYLYSTAWQAHQDALPLLRPVYLENPDEETAYHQGQEYKFGDDVLVAPIVTPGAGPGRVGTQTVWFPPGDWYQVFSGEKFTGPSDALVAADINTFPLFARGGKPLALQPYTARPTTAALTHLVVRCYPGRDGEEGVSFLHEDDGISDAYQKDDFATTRLSYKRNGSAVTVQIAPVQGSYAGQPEKRAYTIEFPDSDAPGAVTANGQSVPANYNATAHTIRVEVPEMSIHEALAVTIQAAPADPLPIRDAEKERLRTALLGGTDANGTKVSAIDPATTETLHAIDGVGIVAKKLHPYLLGDERVPVYYDRDATGPVPVHISAHGKTKDFSLSSGQMLTMAELGDIIVPKPFHGLSNSVEVTVERPAGKMTSTLRIPAPVVETDNLARQAKVSVSSFTDAPSGLNDGIIGGYPGNRKNEWISKGQRKGAWAKLTWDTPQSIGAVVLYDRINPNDHVLAGTLSFSDGTTLPVGELPNDGQTPAQISFPSKTVTWVRFTIDKVSPETQNVGLAEMGVFAAPRPDLESAGTPSTP